MLEIIDYKDIKKYKKYFTTDLNHSSNLYFDKDKIHKVLYYMPKEMDIILNIIDGLNLEELVMIKNLIYKEQRLVGYSVKNYKEYKSLNKFKNRNFELKKQDSIKLVNTYSKLLNEGLSYRDFHLGNVLLNPKTNDIKICDLDSICFFDTWTNEKYAQELLLETILEYLYNISFRHVRNVINSGYLSNVLNGQKNELSVENILRMLDCIDYETVKTEKEKIIEKSKHLIKTGYAKFK